MAASEPKNRLSRRRVIVGGATVVSGALLGACTSTPPPQGTPLPRNEPVPLRSPEPTPEPTVQRHRAMYGTLYDGGFQIPAVPIERIDPRFYRQMVNDPTGEAPGTVVVDTSNHFLYLVERNGRAMRYGVGLGRAGFDWSGRGVIEWKQEWPRWFPPDEMIDRQPELEIYRARQVPGTNRWEGGMEAGLQNPLGARALYIFQDGRDTLYRIHGSPEWWSIGTSVSSGCVRMINQDVIDLYDRVPEQSPILVRSGGRFA